MADRFAYSPNGRPFFFRGGSTGCLLIHGFTGVPGEMRWLGEYLAAQGHTVLGVRQTGHGSDPEDLQHATWRHWLGSGADALHLLQDQCEHVFVMGLSMGGMTAINLAVLFPVNGIVTMSTPVIHKGDWRLNFVDVIAPFRPYQKKKPADPAREHLRAPDHYSYPVWPVRAVKQFMEYVRYTHTNLPNLKTPILIAHSKKDDFIGPENANVIKARVGSTDKDLIWLEESDHVITEGPERHLLFNRIQKFIIDHKN